MYIVGPTTFERNNLGKLVPKNLRNIFGLSYFGQRKKGFERNYALYNNNKKMVGFALTVNQRPFRPVLYIQLIVTKVHGKGYGQMLMSRIKNNAKKNGFERINLSTVNNKKTRRFYNRQGFTMTPNQSDNSSLSYKIS